MKKVYLDNAATTKPKPDGVVAAMVNYFTESGCSPGRGGYACSLQAGRMVLAARFALAELFNVATPQQIIFTHNATYALNYAIKGLLRQGDHVITTTMEHNSVIRPLRNLEQKGVIQVDYIQCNPMGQLAVRDVKSAIRENTRMIVLTHASNVTGTLMPVADIGEIALANDIMFVLDTAQSAGVYPIDVQALHLDILAFTGHKGLMGPPGTGGFAVSERAANEMTPLIEGGTGSVSDKEYQPDFLPDKFESGTMNTPGIAGLKAGVDFIQDVGLDNIRTHELTLTKRFLQGLEEITEIKVHGPANIKEQTSTVSIAVQGSDLGELSYALDDKYGIMTRSGLHCAPLAHKTIGSYPAGTLRFSIGYFNTEEDIDYALECLKKLTYSK